MKQLFHTFALFVAILFATFTTAYAQNALVGSGFGGYNDFSTLNYFGSGVGSTRIFTTNPRSTGNCYFRMARGWSGDNSQYTSTTKTCVNGNDYDVSALGSTALTLNNTNCQSGAFYINCPNTTDNYVFKTPDGAAGTSFVYFRIQGAVRSVNSVSLAVNTCAGDNVTVTATLSGAFATGQGVYLRYSTNSFASSTVVAMTGSATAYTANLTGLPSGGTLQYYVFTSGTTGVTSSGSNADLYTINLNNNGGSNYSYSIPNTSAPTYTGISGGAGGIQVFPFTNIYSEANVAMRFPKNQTTVTIKQAINPPTPTTASARLYYATEGTMPTTTYVTGSSTVSGSDYIFTFSIPVSAGAALNYYIDYTVLCSHYYGYQTGGTPQAGAPTTAPTLAQLFHLTVEDASSIIDGANVTNTTDWAYADGDWRANVDGHGFCLAKTNSATSNILALYLDTDPTLPPTYNSAATTLVGKSDYSVTPNLPFNPAARLLWNPASSILVYERSDGMGGWTGVNLHSACVAAAGANDRELCLDWQAITGSNTAPTAVNFFAFEQTSGGSILSQTPAQNPTGAVSSPENNFYFSVPDITAVASPFQYKSFTLSRPTGASSYIYTASLPSPLYDLTIDNNYANNTINENSNLRTNANNTANRLYVGANFSLLHNLYVGANSSLTPNDNTTPTLTFAGADNHIYNKGRIDANPNAGGGTTADVLATNLSVSVTGNLTLETATVAKDVYRFANITLETPAQMVVASGGTLANGIELQWGTLWVKPRARLDLYNSAASYANVGIRGDWAAKAVTYEIKQETDAYIRLNGLLVGRRPNSVSNRHDYPNILRPAAGTNAVTVFMMGNLENFSEIQPQNGAGSSLGFSFINTTTDQLIRSNYGETRAQNDHTGSASVSTLNAFGGAQSVAFIDAVRPRTVLGNITVQKGNTNLILSDYATYNTITTSNDIATNVEYVVTGAVNIVSGRVVTRTLTNNSTAGSDCSYAANDYHKLTLMPAATISVPACSGSNTNAGNSTGYVDGPLRRIISGTGSASFPTGKSGKMRLLTLTATNSGTDLAYAAEQTECQPSYTLGNNASANGKTPLVDETISVQPSARHWKLHRDPDATQATNAAWNASVTLSYNEDDYGTSSAVHISDPAKMRVVKNIGGDAQWYNFGGAGSAAYAGSISSDVFSSFSNLAIGVAGLQPLPIKLLYFGGEAVGRIGKLHFATATELNTRVFAIERSTDGTTFAEIGRVAAYGNSITRHDYAFDDTHPTATVHYYRLRSIDIDGSSEVSNIIAIRFTDAHPTPHITLYPNPAHETLEIAFADFPTTDTPNAPTQLDIIDALGRVVQRETVLGDAVQYTLDVRRLSGGVYFVRLQSGVFSAVREFVKAE